jgi:hypothetical protein
MGKGCRKGAVTNPGDVGSACSGAGGGSGSASCGTGGGGCGAASRVGGCGGGAGNGCGRGVAAGTVVGRIADGAAGGAAGATAGRLRERRPPVGILECTKTTTRRNRGSWEPRRPRAPTRRWMVAGANSSGATTIRVWVREGTCEHKIARNGLYPSRIHNSTTTSRCFSRSRVLNGRSRRASPAPSFFIEHVSSARTRVHTREARETAEPPSPKLRRCTRRVQAHRCSWRPPPIPDR